MDGLQLDELSITVDEGDPTRITWRGLSALQDPAKQMGPFFEELAEKLAGKEAIVDFTNLRQMNSATVLTIVNLCRSFDNKNIKTELRYDGASDWQSVTFEGLSTVSRVMKNISVFPAPKQNI